MRTKSANLSHFPHVDLDLDLDLAVDLEWMFRAGHVWSAKPAWCGGRLSAMAAASGKERTAA
jgi:hypothetical protein